MTDIVQRLERYAIAENSPELVQDIRDAIAEIEKLRRIAGAVTADHNSFRDMFRRNSNAL